MGAPSAPAALLHPFEQAFCDTRVRAYGYLAKNNFGAVFYTGTFQKIASALSFTKGTPLFEISGFG